MRQWNSGQSVDGALAGATAAAVWALQQPLDKRLIGTTYDDVELLGKLVTRGPSWPVAGLAIHVANGALFGALYTHVKPYLPGPPAGRGLAAAMVEHFGLWSLARLTDRFHPARAELESLAGNRRALAAATWRHAVFGLILGLLEHRMTGRGAVTIRRPGADPPTRARSSVG
ncbi:MAG: hypothetical protein ACRDMA_01585 [Solirubrobacterales bacterium]